jgi:hypothetical protein
VHTLANKDNATLPLEPGMRAAASRNEVCYTISKAWLLMESGLPIPSDRTNDVIALSQKLAGEGIVSLVRRNPTGDVMLICKSKQSQEKKLACC